ncbi:hypothetical protein ACFYXM_10090 [Streptomyces sp. NPDC002476]|uniref:hypothetical protein n=1 Tax=Streptomyces sp. NPDC002476 TaxID=3364648 RepID=UPI0036B61E13
MAESDEAAVIDSPDVAACSGMPRAGPGVLDIGSGTPAADSVAGEADSSDA